MCTPRLFFLVALVIALTASAADVATPTGEFLTLKLDHSDRYPGTVRTITVYVPRAYTGQQPACLLLRMDGIGSAIPLALDSLIEVGDIPVMICVTVPAGRVMAADGTVLRYNRSNEYDRMTPTWVEFVEHEVLPQVEKLTTADGRPIRLSRRPEDRAITGLSSSGIAAFTAAWTHPDYYSRVYSIVGTFVPMRGGDTYPGLVRKAEPRPIRVFLQDNDQDTWNLNLGSWYEYNLLLASALRYAGYDIRTQWDAGHHSGTNGERIMTDVLRWLWTGWPAPVLCPVSANALTASLVRPGHTWISSDTLMGTASHEAIYPGGAFVVRSKPHSACLMTWIRDGGVERYGQQFYWLHTEGADLDEAPFLAFDTCGYLYATTPMGIQVCDHNGRVRSILATPIGGVESFGFCDSTLYIRVDGQTYRRTIGHVAAQPDSKAPKSQGEG